MAIFGIGAYYEKDISGEFIRHKIVGIGWDVELAPDLHEYIKSLKVGDIIYIKSAPPRGDLTIKAIGIICDSEIVNADSFGGLVQIGRNVTWITTKGFSIRRNVGKNNVKFNTIYEEFSPKVQKMILKEFKDICKCPNGT
jgi:hypothetical protein